MKILLILVTIAVAIWALIIEADYLTSEKECQVFINKSVFYIGRGKLNTKTGAIECSVEVEAPDMDFHQHKFKPKKKVSL